jgi:hypothetical protein
MSRQSDDFVARLVKDPGDPPDLLLMSGYLGASSEDGHVRLYLDEELSRYVEIPKEAIRHARELPPGQSPLGGSLLWIDRKAELMHGKAGGERLANFLEGWIEDEYREVAEAVPPAKHIPRAKRADITPRPEQFAGAGGAPVQMRAGSGPASIYYACYAYNDYSSVHYCPGLPRPDQKAQFINYYYYCGGGRYATRYVY